MIGSHIVYKRKNEEDGTMRLKARICPHGNHDTKKDNIKKDSSTAQFDIIRLMLSLLKFTGYRIGLVHTKGAYLQSGPIQRKIYARPPFEW